MDIAAEDIPSWIGAEAVDPSGEKVGKVSNVYFNGDSAVVVEIQSGLVGRKHHLASLTGATVSREHLRLGPGVLVAASGEGVGDAEMAELVDADSTLGGVQAGGLESLSEREERRAAAEEARERAEQAEADAEARRQEEAAAQERAEQAQAEVGEAQEARIAAETAATQARAEADGMA